MPLFDRPRLSAEEDEELADFGKRLRGVLDGEVEPERRTALMRVEPELGRCHVVEGGQQTAEGDSPS